MTAHWGKKNSWLLKLGYLPILILFISGCSAGGPKKPTPLTQQGKPVAPAQSLASITPAYIIHSGDDLEVKFFYNPSLNEKVAVRSDGRISLQLIREVQASSLTTSELSTVLERKYSSFLKDPSISVIVRSSDSRKIFIDGEVAKPGMLETRGQTTLMQAIASAGGMQDSAHREEVLVIRRNKLQNPFVLKIDLASVIDGTDLTQDILLKPYDIIYVPKSAIANINTFVDLYIRKNIPLSLNYSFLNNTID